ncbi:MAG: NAD-dependent epimerase/dehydratase family protein [Legionella sp.]|nr:NAD-dependent epimerase/dehydratase family protein [Legionella sp.]
MKIVLPGGAGLVGQNLVARLKARGYTDVIILDKHRANTQILQQMHPEYQVECVDVSIPGSWQHHFAQADAVVMLQAQIGGYDYQDFITNNVTSTKLILDTIKKYQVPHLVHISSSVVESIADDFYTRSKKAQEELVIHSGLHCPILRPTLMFGWFDRKHLGWLSRFMQKVPVFPIPGHGKYMRQPLYAGDFCEIIIHCLEHPDIHGIFNISGHEKIDYIDIIRLIKKATRAKTPIAKIPYSLFYALLWTWGKLSKNPPFTTQQLAALSAKDEFEIINWPELFSVPYTPFAQAVEETFNHPQYSKIILEF